LFMQKYIQNIISRILSIRFTDVVNTSSNNSATKLCDCCSSICKDIRNNIFGYFIPLIIINLHYVLVSLFISSSIIDFIENPLEIYEFSMKNLFNGYLKEEKRLFAYRIVSFIFGIGDIDDGYIYWT
ncbi:unnamed protein product, partial [Rotaria sp. Silwood2]